jgi:serine/threonine protein kinase
LPVDGLNAAVGEVIGGYRLERLIGAGSTSQVFLGAHVRLGRKSAIKILAAQLLDNQDVVSRLLQEARVVNDIRHPNIIDIVDFIETESPRRVALVMEYIDGPSLKTLRDHRLSYDQAVGLALQLVEAVKAAHAAGVIHRDIKPDNLLLTTDPRIDDGRVPLLKMVDFGIAKLAGATGGRTAAGTMLGTPAYMAPEQVAGRPAPSAATDVFAVGEVIYELFTGQRAYPATTIHETVRAKLRGEMPKLELPPIPGREMLLALITRCLERKPTDRPELEEVHRVLNTLKAGSLRLPTIEGLQTELSVPDGLGPTTEPPGSSGPYALRNFGPPAAKTELSPIGPAMTALSELAQGSNRIGAVATELGELDRAYAEVQPSNAAPTRPTELPVHGLALTSEAPPGHKLAIPAEASSPTNKVLPALTLAIEAIPEREPLNINSARLVRREDRDEITAPPTRLLPAIDDQPSSSDLLSMPDRDAITMPPQLALLQPAGVGALEDPGDQATRVTHLPAMSTIEPLVVPEPPPPSGTWKAVAVVLVIAALILLSLVLTTR